MFIFNKRAMWEAGPEVPNDDDFSGMFAQFAADIRKHHWKEAAQHWNNGAVLEEGAGTAQLIRTVSKL